MVKYKIKKFIYSNTKILRYFTSERIAAEGSLIRISRHKIIEKKTKTVNSEIYILVN